jgi:DNA-directed RNA polymerase specialized sigma24 family protein
LARCFGVSRTCTCRGGAPPTAPIGRSPAPAEELRADDRGVYADPGVRVPAIANARAALEQVPAGMTRRIIQLRVDGYANRQIAHLLETTVGAVESRLNRYYRSLP